ncbi:OPT oligopeptide transporter [Lophiotrema nucula]|uniref:OPT oligopeptide transporter n=1 Tax=Lophiotrema nucula TaxID=690887 RepID=A0A6A5ZDM6_9PLEO|nr:OPT oligopeptide transporter [Lophiotrema nucula]
MANKDEKEIIDVDDTVRNNSAGVKELPAYVAEDLVDQVENDLNLTGEDLAKAQETAKELDLDQTRAIFRDVIQNHENDQNFPMRVLESMKEFVTNEDIYANPQNYEKLISEMRVEAALISNDSPYPEVRAVVDNTDDPSLPCSTIRAWVIGIIYVAAGSLINQLFYIRQPTITLQANVAQLLAYPAGKAWEKLVPDWQFSLFGQRHSLNPGKFNKKEHMLITIMANVGFKTIYTTDIVLSQFLPQYFNQKYAADYGYQLLLTLSTNFIGYGIAGLTRQFLVYPAHCVWPSSLVTIALNQSFHTDTNPAVPGPFRRIFTMSKLRCFTYAFLFMFVYFWLPNYLFTALSLFSWITWIAPNNRNLATITGMNNGMGINPLSTFDWNILTYDLGNSPLVLPFFYWANEFIGITLGAFLILGFWYTNIFNTSYLPINTPRVFDHFAEYYNVTKAIDDRGIFDAAKYEAYSPPFLSAGYLVVYMFFFAIYTSVITWTLLYHRHEIWRGLKALFRKRGQDNAAFQDVHNRLMAKYNEVPEWWYLIVLLLSIGFGLGGILGWPTYTSGGVIFYGIALCLVFIVPVGIVKAITGFEITLNVLAEFIGGSWVAGNALAMNFFKSFGYVTCAHTLNFAQDLKMAHYVKIPPRHTFTAQMVATLVCSFVTTSILNFQMNEIPGVCTATQKDHYTCPGINQFFTAAVLWGTVGPKKVFGKGGMYTWLLFGFPMGVVFPVMVYFGRKWWPKQRWLRNIHPPALFYGGIQYAPYNISYLWPCVIASWVSHIYFKRRYTAFWSKYNYIVSAAFSSGVAIAAIIIFFALQMPRFNVNWWGNEVVSAGCEGDPCVRLTLADGEYFGPRIGQFH